MEVAWTGHIQGHEKDLASVSKVKWCIMHVISLVIITLRTVQLRSYFIQLFDYSKMCSVGLNIVKETSD